jgi:hypothetical protein
MTDASLDSSVSACFVAYGCTTYVCSTEPDGGEGGDLAVTVSGAVPASGPLAVLGGGDASADAGVGADEAYSLASGNTILGTAQNLPQGNADRTMALWMQTTATFTGTMFNYGSFTPDERCGLLQVGGHEYFVGEDNDLSGSITINDGNWHHVAMTLASSVLSVYVDGVLDESEDLGTPLNTTGQTWEIGNTVTDSTTREPFAGSISDVRVYDRALSERRSKSSRRSRGPTRTRRPSGAPPRASSSGCRSSTRAASP